MNRKHFLGIFIHAIILCGAVFFFQSCPMVADKENSPVDTGKQASQRLWVNEEETGATDASLFCVAALTGDQEAPPLTATAAGTAHIYLDPIQGGGWLDVEHTVIEPVSAKLHAGTPGAAGESVLDLGSPASPIHYRLSSEEVDRLGGLGMLYVNIASAEFPDGEIRGDFICDTIKEEEQLYCTQALTGLQEAPPVETEADGTVYVYMNTRLGTGRVKIEHTVTDPVAVTLYTGLPGETGDIVLPLGGAKGPIDVTFTPTEVVRLGGLGMLYVNITSTAYPNGEIRCDLLCGEGIGPESSVDMEGEIIPEGQNSLEGENAPEDEPASEGELNNEGEPQSEGAPTVDPEPPQSQMTLSHTATRGVVTSGETLDIEVQLDYANAYEVSALAIQATFPPGWIFMGSVAGDIPQLAPKNGTSPETFDFLWFMIPAFPIHFTYRVSPPADASGTYTYQAMALYRERASGELHSNITVHEITMK